MKIHFIAIGGSAMHNLAIALHNKGYEITGSDDEIFEPSRTRLAEKGLLPKTLDWDKSRISSQLDAVILGMHAHKDNPELLEAQKQGVKIYSYPEFLYEQTKNKTRIVVGGSHGKTTTTAMIMHIMKECGKNFDYMVGAQLSGFDNMVRLSKDTDLAIFEGDEYLSSPIDRRPKFHLYKPHIAVLTGVAWDHINVFPTFENYCSQFESFAKLIEQNGTLIYFDEDKILQQIAKNTRSDIKTLSYNSINHTIINGKTFLKNGQADVPICVFGKHNLQNMNAAYLVCKEVGITDEQFFASIKTFAGANKRLQLLAENEQTAIYHDFAHAPSKLKATVDAVKQQFPKKNVISIMELHTFSSLNSEFLKQYKGSLLNADKAIVYFSPKAIELKRLQPITKDMVQASFCKDGLKVFNDKAELETAINELDVKNAVLLFLSSGNFSGIDLKQLALDLIK